MKRYLLSASVLLTGLSLASLALAETVPSTPASTAQPDAQVTITQTVQMPTEVAPAQAVVIKPVTVSHTQVTVNNNLLDGKYQAYQISLKNERPNHLQILHGEVLNAVDEAFVANEALQKKNQSRRAAGGLLRGLSSVPFAGGFGYHSYGAYRAASLASSAANTAASVAESTAQNEQANVEGRYIRTLNSAFINPNETYTFTALVPKADTPHVKLIFKNLETNEVFDVQQ
jgi:hypothetical protein